MTKSASKPSASFTSELIRSNNKLWGFHVVVPKKTAEKFIEGNNRRILCTLNKTETFQAALLSVGNGDFLITVNKQLRDKLKLGEEDEVLVELKKDTSEFGLPVPEEFVELLAQDEEGNRYFMDLTDGKKRTLLYIIGKPKASDLRIRNGVAILEHLKRQHGQINYKQLNLDLKNTY
jgi:hypothetical protein